MLQISAGLIDRPGPLPTATATPQPPTRTPTLAPTATPTSTGTSPTATPQTCTYTGPYFFSGSLPETAQTTYTFCLTELRAIVEWNLDTDASLGGLLTIDLNDEFVNTVAHTAVDGVGSESMLTAGPGNYFLDIGLAAVHTATYASWTLTIRQ